MKKRFIGVGIALLAVVAFLIGGTVMRAQDTTPTAFIGDPHYPAPAFPTGVDWLNVEKPLTVESLRGKVVVLDFWTYGCINCIHMIPTLEQLEAKYGDALAVIGVHSAKFANEGETTNIRQVVERYGLKHPVINDKDFTVWGAYSAYGVNAWPTFVVIDPRGNLFAVQAGEIPFEAFDEVIGGMIATFDGFNEIDRNPMPIKLESETSPSSTLAFPGKVTVDSEGGRLFIADSSHNRLVVADLNTYEVLDVIGTGAAGLTDGGYDEATFSKPQGMAFKDGILYVADTDNHVIRAVNVDDKTVSTVAGTGVQGYDRTGGTLLATDLSSPWDVTFDDANNLYIAMAGTHQIWMLSFDNDTVMPVVGSGREGLLNGDLMDSQLAQPSGLYWYNNVLYFADSESSSVRAADFNTNKVITLAGPDMNDLFTFGDVDGRLGESRLQHTLAVVGDDDGTLYVADTYNSKIKRLDPQAKQIRTLFGLGGNGGFRDGDKADAQFDEPGGLAYADGKLYVADTNNDAIRVIDLTAGTVNTIHFPNPEALQIEGAVTVVGGNAAAGETLAIDAQTVGAGSGEISLNVTLPEGYKLNGIAPFTAEWSSSGEAVSFAEGGAVQSIVAPELPLVVPVTLAEGEATVTGSLTIYYCEAVNESLCFIDRVTVSLPVTVTADAATTTLTAERVIVPPEVTVGGFS
ncbi:MAG: redoxin domain-containing protein [Chloroflexi bacterium]|nr:redoxin domain-containing protein [Chloroflexota bacterium]MCC6897252.1 redoxin domain-containing protein [Anaerolineae bacterium]